MMILEQTGRDALSVSFISSFFVLLGEGYIFGGETAKQGELPFMALLGYRTEYNEIRYQCGGALINRFH